MRLQRPYATTKPCKTGPDSVTRWQFALPESAHAGWTGLYFIVVDGRSRNPDSDRKWGCSQCKPGCCGDRSIQHLDRFSGHFRDQRCSELAWCGCFDGHHRGIGGSNGILPCKSKVVFRLMSDLYVSDGDQRILAGVGFSASVAPSLEAQPSSLQEMGCPGNRVNQLNNRLMHPHDQGEGDTWNGRSN